MPVIGYIPSLENLLKMQLLNYIKSERFDSIDDFPEIGKEDWFYIDKSDYSIYIYDTDEYRQVSGGSSNIRGIVDDANLPIIMTEFQGMGSGGNQYSSYTTAIQDLAATLPNVYSVDVTGAGVGTVQSLARNIRVNRIYIESDR